MSRVGGVGHNLPQLPQGPRYHLLSSADDTLQSALVLDSGSSISDSDGGGEDGLNDGGGAAVGVQGEKQRGKDAALRGSGADGP